MNATDWLHVLMCTALVFALGWVTRGLHDHTRPKPEFRRVEHNVHPATRLIPCPVTAHGIAEWKRTCSAEKRSEAIKPKGHGL